MSAAVRAPPKVTLSPESKRRGEREREREESGYLAILPLTCLVYTRARTCTHTQTLIHKTQRENSTKQGWITQKIIKMKKEKIRSRKKNTFFKLGPQYSAPVEQQPVRAIVVRHTPPTHLRIKRKEGMLSRDNKSLSRRVEEKKR